MTSEPNPPNQKAHLLLAMETYHADLDERTLDYLGRRGLAGVAESLKFGTVLNPLHDHTQARGRLAIPYIGPSGAPYYVKFRCIEDHECDEAGHPKYLNISATLRPYNTRALTAPTDYIFLTEGELDAATIEACGWPAVGLGGANEFKSHYSRMLSGFSKPVLLADGDEAGERLAARFRKHMPSHAIVIVSEIGMDVNSTYVQGGKAALEEMIRGAK